MADMSSSAAERSLRELCKARIDQAEAELQVLLHGRRVNRAMASILETAGNELIRFSERVNAEFVRREKDEALAQLRRVAALSSPVTSEPADRNAA